MRIISPTGKVLNVSKVVPLAETVVNFNGKKNLFVEEAISLEVKPSALKLFVQTEQIGMAYPHIVVGNLTQEKREEIQQALLTEDCYDFSKMTYQKYRDELSFRPVPVIDGGISNPYYNEVCMSFDMPFGNNLMPNMFMPEEEEGEEDTPEEMKEDTE